MPASQIRRKVNIQVRSYSRNKLAQFACAIDTAYVLTELLSKFAALAVKATRLSRT